MNSSSSPDSGANQPTIRELSGFNPASGSLLERALFNHRGIVLLLCLLLTLGLGWQTVHLRLNASFEKMIPTSHPFIANYLQYRSELTGLGNSVRIAVTTDGASIYDASYLATLQKISDEVFLMPGVDRAYMKSVWTPGTRWAGVTEDGLEGGPVIPDGYDGSPKSIEALRANLARSNEFSQLVARDLKSSVIVAPLLSTDAATGKALDYAAFGRALEDLRSRYQGKIPGQTLTIQITGFAKVVGDLIDGLRAILLFFAVAIATTTAVLFAYTRCVRSTLLVVACSLVAVLWQLGALPLLGYELDPYSVLVPFLVFAIGMSHGAQKMNGIMQDIGRGTHRLVAARYTFRRLFLAGLTALLCDAVGFAVLMLIRIRVIQDLAIIASLGVAVLIFTNLILLPVLLSYVGVSASAARRSLRDQSGIAESATAPNAQAPWLWRTLNLFTQRRWARITVGAAMVLGMAGYATSLHLKIGDLDPGAPELRARSRYNRDAAAMTASYGASSDVFAVMVKTPDNGCSNVDTLRRVDALDWEMTQVPGVESTDSLALLARRMSVGLNEGSPRWYDLPANQNMLNTITAGAPRGLYNESCSLLTQYTYLSDHRAETLERVVARAQSFADANQTPGAEFLLAAGSAGIEAATNIVVKQASHEMLLWVYAAVILLCLITFRSWRAVLCAVLPLVLTSILSEALMVALGIGVKVATLPVIALGVGIGVDYALYVMSIVLAGMKEGESLSQAYRRALQFTGKVVMLTGVTLAIGVATWAASPIKFQADMGILLAFMFLWNMLGALVLLPALAHFLLRPVPANSERLPAHAAVPPAGRSDSPDLTPTPAPRSIRVIKMMMAVRRKPGMSLADYRDYIRVQHGKLALDQPNGVLRYVQNHVFDGAYGSASDAQHGPMFARDSVTELWFAGLPEFGRNMAHSYTRDVIIPDGKNFADVATNIVVVTREEDVAVANPGGARPGAVKVMHFLQRRSAIGLDEFFRTLARGPPQDHCCQRKLAACLRRSMLSHALPPPGSQDSDRKPPQASQEFSGTALPAFHGVASLWFDDEAALPALRGYLHDLQALGGGESGFFDSSAGFYVCAHETTIFDFFLHLKPELLPMKFATLNDGTRDGRLHVVSRDLARAVDAGAIAPTLLAALEQWEAVEPALQALYEELEAGRRDDAFAFDATRVMAPLPRAPQWCDGSAFLNHGRLMETAFRAPPIPDFETVPVMYQGASDDLLGPTQDVPLPDEAHGIDFEGEFGVIVGAVPMGCTAKAAGAYIRLLVQINDWSLRALGPHEMKTGFGFLQAKPSTAFAPVAITPDELGDAWQDQRVHLDLHIAWNGKRVGIPNGSEMNFSFAELIAHAARTRRLSAGTIIGSGTVSNVDRAAGSACIAELRVIEIIDHGEARTGFMRFGDRVRMSARDAAGNRPLAA